MSATASKEPTFAQVIWDVQRSIEGLALEIKQAVRRDEKTED